MDTIEVRDLENPVGEEKRIVAFLKSFGARNAANVTRVETPGLHHDEPVVSVTWTSEHGEFKERSWGVTVYLNSEMNSVDGYAYVVVSGSDLKNYSYKIPYRQLNRFLRQRLGNDYIPFLYETDKSFWMNNGGSIVEGYVTSPTWVQWALGDFEFHKLKAKISDMLRPSKFLPEFQRYSGDGPHLVPRGVTA